MPTLLPLPQCPNNIPKTTKAPIDILCLLQPLPRRTTLTKALATSQIDKIKRPFGPLTRDIILPTEFENKDGMRAGRALIRFGSSDTAIRSRLLEDRRDG